MFEIIEVSNVILSMYKPNCEAPILLFNKFVFSMIQSGGSLYLAGSPVFVTSIHQIPVTKWLQSARSYSDAELDSSYCVLDGNKEQLFLFVPCMSCTLCRHSKQVDLINRSILETLTWDTPPVFFTLTYRDADLPRLVVGRKSYNIGVGELRYKDIQDFFKRLRSRWTRKGLKHDVRYLVAGEYGSKLGRCHWHVILWNNPYHASEMDVLLFEQLRKDVFESWGHCEPQSFDFGQCKGGAAPYATKYVTKPQVTHGHHTKPMIRCSSGSRGGLGSIYLKPLLDYLRSNPSINYLDYVDKKGNYAFMYYSKSISRKVWPSLSASVPSGVRSRYRQLLDCLIAYSTCYPYHHELSNIASLLRPRYLTNDFKPQPMLHCWIASVYRCKLLQPVINQLVDELSDLMFIDVNYRNSLYLHKLSFVPFNTSSKAQQISKLKQQESVLLSKEKF